MKAMRIWYSETSAVHYFQKHITEDTIATKTLQLSKGRSWRLSPVTLWEILLTSDESRREILIDFCQHLYTEELLPSPSEIIISYIKSGAGLYEPIYTLESNTEISRVWKEVTTDTRKTIIHDMSDLSDKVELFRIVGRELHKILRNDDFILDPNLIQTSLDLTISQLTDIVEINLGFKTKGKDRILRKVCLFFAILVLCAELDLDNQPIKDYWMDVGIDDNEKRIEYIISKIPRIVETGPLVNMALMAMTQAEEKYSRGLWFDCLHSIYISYVDLFLTNDGHFSQLSTSLGDNRLSHRIVNTANIELHKVPRDWLGREII